MCDVYETYSSQKKVYKWAKHGFATISPSQKYTMKWKHWLSNREKVLGVVVSKEGDAESLLWYERNSHYWFSWKRFNCKQCFLLPTL